MVAPPTVRSFVAVIFLLAGWGARATPTEEEIARAIEQLGSETLKVREEASRLLWAAGKSAEPALQKAVKSPDAEVAWRAQEILKKLQYGLYPDTPPEIQKLVERYLEGDGETKRFVLMELSGRGGRASIVFSAIIISEKDENLRQDALNQAGERITGILSDLLLSKDSAAVEKALELFLDREDDLALRNYAVLHLLQGSLGRKITEFKTRMEQTFKPSNARTLAYLHRANGDLEDALQAARKSGNKNLLKMLLCEFGDWKTLATLQADEGADPHDIEKLGFLAACRRLAGDARGFQDAITGIEKFGGHMPDDQWFVEKALFLNDRPVEGMNRTLKHPNPLHPTGSSGGARLENLALDAAREKSPHLVAVIPSKIPRRGFQSHLDTDPRTVRSQNSGKGPG